MPKPNIIFILVDQMRGDCLSSAGHRCVQTPNLDCLASRGTRFEHAYTAVPSCLPARATIMTGLNQWHAGLLGMGKGQEGGIPNDYPHTLAGELTQNGYQTHLVGKGHFSPQRTSMGFESAELDESGRMKDPKDPDEYRKWFEENKDEDITPDDHGVDWNSWIGRPWHTKESLHPSAWTMNRGIHFLKNRDLSKPFFLHLSFARPHSPYVPPQFYFDLYYRDETPPAFMGDWADMHDNPVTAQDVNAWRGKKTAQQIHRGRSGYYGEISFIDAQVGRLLNWMKRYCSEEYKNTWFVFASDHGDMVGDHNLWRKTYAYEGSARIPFIVARPAGIEKANRKVSDEAVELRDIMPTVLDIAQVDIPDLLDGKSVLPLMDNEDSSWREYIHGEHCTCYKRAQEMQYVTNGKRKYIWLPRADIQQFFDLEVDPGECRNLINDPSRQEEINTWRGYLAKELEARDCGWAKDGELIKPSDEPLVSPYRYKRFG